MKSIFLWLRMVLVFLLPIVLAVNKLDAQKVNISHNSTTLSIENRVKELLSQMTLEEKIELLGGTGFETRAIKRLGIPELKMTDGALGVRWGQSTAFPCGTAMAASWDTTLIRRIGKAIAQEAKAKGRDVLLGPNVNIARIPLNGRTFEAFGEDPYLTSELAVSYIKGVQSENVIATVKHFCCNNQEYNRAFINEIVDQRALHEVYFPAFKAAVLKGHVLAVMAAYNKVNGTYCSENSYLLRTELEKKWGFKGLVMSDWGAVHSSIPTVNSGLDLEMPTGKYL
ncbi:MAG: glycoside hydrolase family 3 N-terminal domain-containing protein, partial [Candidatus Kryptoniota bacterium]